MIRSSHVNFTVYCAVLCAAGVLVSMYSPFKLESTSPHTLASHVPIMIAMFISPFAALYVSLGTTLGILLAGSPAVVVFRVATHLTFAQFGALYLSERPQILEKRSGILIFSFLIACMHAFAETVVVIPYFFENSMNVLSYNQDFFMAVMVQVGIGTIIHSLVDFEVAILIWKVIIKPLGHVTTT